MLTYYIFYFHFQYNLIASKKGIRIVKYLFNSDYDLCLDYSIMGD